MSIEELVGLSVDDLKKELKDGAYGIDVLRQLLAAEEGDKNRSTAAGAIKVAISDILEGDNEPEARAPGVYVCQGKSVTTKGGLKGPGASVSEKDMSEESAKKLIAKGFLEVQE